MAFLVPDNLRSRKDVAETIRRVAGAFQVALDEDVTVWYEPLFDPAGDRPHLVVLEPRLGVIVLEVLKGKDKSFLGAIRGKLQVEIDGSTHELDDPLLRANSLAATLRMKLDETPALSGVPVAAAAVFSGANRSDAEKLGAHKVVELDHCLFKADLDDALGNGNGAPLLRVFHRAIGTHPEHELNDEQLNILRGLIHPDVVITSSPQQGALFTPGEGEDVVRVMDRKQEALAKSLGVGHRVIRGVAGSGKTLVLVYRARLLARLLPNRQILVTCFTRSLASQLRTQLSEFDNVDVVHLDRLMAREIKSAGMKHPGYRNGSDPVVRAALQAADKTGGGEFRAVLVDEAQDFDSDALKFCVKLFDTDDPDEQDLIIVADSAQNIFRKNFRWKDAGIKAQGRTRILRVNYRNTREVLEFAHTFLTLDNAIEVDELPDSDSELTIVPAESAERSGPVPNVTVTSASEVADIVRIVRDWGATTAPSRAIAVLVGDVADGATNLARNITEALRSEGVSSFWVTDPDQKDNKDRAGSADEPVIVSTIQSAKGLEYSKVIVTGLGVRDDETTSRKLLYVGFTRAVDELHVVARSDSPFADDLRQAHAAVTSA